MSEDVSDKRFVHVARDVVAQRCVAYNDWLGKRVVLPDRPEPWSLHFDAREKAYFTSKAEQLWADTVFEASVQNVGGELYIVTGPGNADCLQATRAKHRAEKFELKVGVGKVFFLTCTCSFQRGMELFCFGAFQTFATRSGSPLG